MRYKAKSIAALRLTLGSLPDQMPVEVEPAKSLQRLLWLVDARGYRHIRIG